MKTQMKAQQKKDALLTAGRGVGPIRAAVLFAAVFLLTANTVPSVADEHPYLFFSGQNELEQIRRRFDEAPQSWYLRSLIAHSVASAVNTEGHGTNLWAYLLTGEQRYRRRCLRWIEREWDRTDFSEEWIGFEVNRMAQIYDTLYAELTEEQRSRMRDYLKRALTAHLEKMGSWFYTNPSNTVPAQGGAAGMAALALRDEDPRAPEAIRRTRRILADYADACFSPDGGYIEGTLYWSFGVSFYLIFAHADHNTTGNDELLNHPDLLKQHRFVETMLGGDGEFMTFNDTGPWLNAWAVCADLGRRTENELLLWIADHMAAIHAYERDPGAVHADVAHSYPPSAWIMMTQSDPRPARDPGRPFPGVPTVSVLGHQQWGVIRSSSDYIPDLVVGVKGSRGMLSHHAHHDLGSFVLHAGGEKLLFDPGYHYGEADDHTLPLIDGTGPGLTGSDIVAARESGDRRFIEIDSTEGYTAKADRVRRLIAMIGDRAVVILDDILPTGAAVTAQYQAAHRAEVRADGHAVVHGENGTLGLWTFGPDLSLQVSRRSFGRGFGFNDWHSYDWHSVTGDYTAEADTPLVTVLVPSGNTPSPSYSVGEDSITVTLADGETVRFEQRRDGWKHDGSF